MSDKELSSAAGFFAPAPAIRQISPPGERDHFNPGLTARATYAVFSTDAANLVLGDGNAVADVFLQNLSTGAITLVSRTAQGVPGDDASYNPAVSADGAYVVFASDAGNLVPGNDNGVPDVLLEDGLSGAVSAVSTTAQGASANGTADNPSLSADGRYVAFDSLAANLVADDGNDAADVFVKNTQTGAVLLLSTTANGKQGDGGSYTPSLSADGSVLAFRSDAGNLVKDDSNQASDIFLKNLLSGAISRLSTTSSGAQANNGSYTPSLSADGLHLAFRSDADNLAPEDGNGVPDVFSKDLQTGAVTLISADATGLPGNGGSYTPSISAAGRYVAFRSDADNLVAGDDNGVSDIFIKDGKTGAIVRLSVAADGSEGNQASYNPSLSANGRFVAFESYATNLVPGDNDGKWSDIFLAANPFVYQVTLVTGSDGKDNLTGDGALAGSRDTLRGLRGNDTLAGNQGNDILKGNQGNDLLYGGNGADRMLGGVGNDAQLGGNGADRMRGGNGNDRLTGGVGTDRLAGDNRRDLLNGGAGADSLLGGNGKDLLNGGGGADRLAGGNGDDVYVVDDPADRVFETATGGVDGVTSHLVAYTLPKHVENGVVGEGITGITGNALDNLIYAGSGNNLLDGGDGIDTLSYRVGVAGEVGVSISLAVLEVQASGGSGTDRLQGFENLVGSRHSDALSGDGNANVINGGFGDDSLSGGGGGDGFRFTSALNAKANLDLVLDFDVAEDTLELDQAIFSSLEVTGELAAQHFRIGRVVDADDYLFYKAATGALFYDADGSGAGAALPVCILGTATHPELTAADMVVI